MCDKACLIYNMAKTCNIFTALCHRDAPHYVMPDAAAVVAWLEVLELPEMGGFVLLTSVLKQARHTSAYCTGLGSAIRHAAEQ